MKNTMLKTGMHGECEAWLLGSLFIIGILFLNWTCPFSSDDCFLGLNSFTAQGDVPQRLATFRNAFFENWMDGYRPIVNILTRIFTGCLEKWVFNIANTGMLFCFAACMLRQSRQGFSFRTLALVLTLVFFVLCKGESYLWCTGSVNYLWMGTGSLLFCMLLERLERTDAKWPQVVVCCVFAIFAGWSQEAFSLPILTALCMFLLSRRGPFAVKRYVVVASYAVGVFLLVRIAGRRVATVPAFSPSEMIMTLLKIAVAVKGVWLLLLLIVLSKGKSRLVQRNLFYILAICASVGMIAIVGFNGERCLWAANMFAIAIIVREFRPPLFLARAMSIALITTICVCCVLGFRIRKEFDGFTWQYLESDSGLCCHNHVQCGPFARFLYQFVYAWSDGFHGRSFAHYHCRDVSPVAFSSADYNALLSNEFCIQSNRLPIATEAYTTPDSNTIVIPLADYVPEPSFVKVEYAFPKDFAARLRRELAIRRKPPVANLDVPRTVFINGRRMALVGKLPDSDAYIKGIVLRGRASE